MEWFILHTCVFCDYGAKIFFMSPFFIEMKWMINYRFFVITLSKLVDNAKNGEKDKSGACSS